MKYSPANYKTIRPSGIMKRAAPSALSANLRGQRAVSAPVTHAETRNLAIAPSGAAVDHPAGTPYQFRRWGYHFLR
ncbi:hypothetical protein N9023_00735 [Opitutaceae bacterium]|nr:hypothetical protein [Opitutaceae bacterium]